MFRQALKAARRARAQAFRHSLAQRRGHANANRGTSCAASALGACRDGRSTAASSARSYVAASAAANNSLYGSMLVERIPVVIPEAPAWEREYKEWSEARRDKFRVKLPDQIVEAKGLLDNLPDFEPAPRERRRRIARATEVRCIANFPSSSSSSSRKKTASGASQSLNTMTERRCAKRLSDR